MPQRMRTEGGSRPTRMASLRRAQTRRSRSRSAHVVVPRDKLGYVRPCHGIRNKQYSSTRDHICHLRTALELGAGAGLLAIAAAHLGATVTATDMGRTRARSMRRPQQCKKRRGADHRETSVGLRGGATGPQPQCGGHFFYWRRLGHLACCGLRIPGPPQGQRRCSR
jgi:hypothetical protein